MKTWAILAVPCLLTACVGAEPLRIPEPKAGQVVENIPYCRGGNQVLRMDYYYPPKLSARLPSVIFIAGGGWTKSWRNRGYLTKLFPKLGRMGYGVATVDSRVAPVWGFPAMIEDVKCAVRFLRAKAGPLGLDPAPILAR